MEGPLGRAPRSLRSWPGLLPSVLATPTMVTVHQPPSPPSRHPKPPGRLPAWPCLGGPAAAPTPIQSCPRGARLLRGAPTPCSGLWERRAGPPSRSRLSWTWTAVPGFTAGHRGRLPSGAPITSSPIVFWGAGGGQTWVLSTSPSSPGGRWQTGHFRSLQSPELHLPLSTLPPNLPANQLPASPPPTGRL